MDGKGGEGREGTEGREGNMRKRVLFTHKQKDRHEKRQKKEKNGD